MPRPFNRRQALENQRFLKALRQTGNVRRACEQLCVHRATYTRRRAKDPAFAADWDAALAFAHARLNRAPAEPGRAGEEPAVIRLANGRLQLRRPTRRRLDRAAEQAFLAALSATANVRLAAAAAGFSHSAFYRRRDASPAFAREMRLALEMGYERIEGALLESFDPASHADDAWRHNEPPPIPQMTSEQALQLLYLHQKEARLWGERADRKKRRGESGDQHSARLAGKWKAEKAWDREGYDVTRAARMEGNVPKGLEPEPPALPALDQVTGWSGARKGARKGKRALFGGWRLGDWKEGKGE